MTRPVTELVSPITRKSPNVGNTKATGGSIWVARMKNRLARPPVRYRAKA